MWSSDMPVLQSLLRPLLHSLSLSVSLLRRAVSTPSPEPVLPCAPAGHACGSKQNPAPQRSAFLACSQSQQTLPDANFNVWGAQHCRVWQCHSPLNVLTYNHPFHRRARQQTGQSISLITGAGGGVQCTATATC